MTTAWTAILVDTNILVYVHDPRDRVKQRQAIAVLRQLFEAHRVALSIQCLTEFFNAVTRRLPGPMSAADARFVIEELAHDSRVLPLTPEAVLDACRGVVEHQLSLWDALVWAVARQHGIPYILTEDAPDGRVLEGVTYRNPFLSGCSLPALQADP